MQLAETFCTDYEQPGRSLTADYNGNTLQAPCNVSHFN